MAAERLHADDGADHVAVDIDVADGERVLVRGGFADINATSVTVLAERALPMEELNPEVLDREILQAEMARDATHDFAAQQAADAAIAQLREARAALNF